jgi:hypothetical protein
LNESNGQHLSHSQISLLLRCPRQYYYRYIEKLKSPVGGALILGSSYHRALETNFLAKVKDGKDLGVSVLFDAFDAEWNSRLAHDEIDWQDDSPGELKDVGKQLVDVYMHNAAPFVMPVEVERKFSVHLPELEGYTLDGIIDLITDAGVVVDHKTAARAKSQDDVDQDLQPYAYATAMLTDPALDEIDFEFHTAIKKKSPEIQRLSTKRNRTDVAWYMGLVCEAVKMIRAGIFPPNPCGWHCNPKWCGYWARCKGGAR